MISLARARVALASLVVLAGTTAASAAPLVYTQPTADYINATCMMPIPVVGPDFAGPPVGIAASLDSLQGCGQTLTFSDAVNAEFTAPDSWGEPPDTEGQNPATVRHLAFPNALTLMLSSPIDIVGFEVGTESLLGDVIVVTFFDAFDQPGLTITRTVSAGHALLFAAQSDGAPFASVRVESAAGNGFSLARIRVGAPLVPEPSLMALLALGGLGWLRRRPH